MAKDKIDKLIGPQLHEDSVIKRGKIFLSSNEMEDTYVMATGLVDNEKFQGIVISVYRKKMPSNDAELINSRLLMPGTLDTFIKSEFRRYDGVIKLVKSLGKLPHYKSKSKKK